MNEYEEEVLKGVHLSKILENKRVLFSLAACFVLFFLYLFFLSAPHGFPVNSIYDLKYGQTLSTVATDFKDKNIIRSEFIFKSFVYTFSLGDVKIVAGDYLLYKNQNVLSIAWRITHGNLDIVPVKITIPEGMSSFDIADTISKVLPSFSKVRFIDLIQKQKLEGYIFPDTYFFMPNMTEEEIIKTMNDNYNEKIKEVTDAIKRFGKSESDVIKMASIIEEEARTDESRKIIAGILWKRIAMKMALQVDSSFRYINGKTTKDLSVSDLKIDSPYNSYVYRGLPPTPISNPGLEAILATIQPTKTPYLYFLTDKEGNMHYAATFEEHVANKFKYLK